MSEAIPLSAALCIENEYVIVYGSRCLVVDPLLERLSAKRWFVQGIEPPVQCEAGPVPDLFGCTLLHHIRREQVQHAQVVVFPK